MLTPMTNKLQAAANFSRTAVFGHSMGGMSTPLAAEVAGYNISCMLSSHGIYVPIETENVTVPSMFVTGTADTTVSPATVRAGYEKCPARPKIFVNVVGAGHMEPREGKRMNVLDAHFLACHTGGFRDSCDVIYGNGSHSLCKHPDPARTYAECKIDR